MSALFLLKVLLFIGATCAQQGNPMYKYRFETEDVMKTDASTIPVRGYHVVEGGYFPEGEIGGYGGYGGLNKFGYGSAGGRFIDGAGGFGGRFIPNAGGPYGGGGYGGGSLVGPGFVGGGGFIGGPFYQHGIGGEALNKQAFSSGSKNLNDAGFESVKGNKGVEFNQEQEGFNKGLVGVKNSKADTGYYNQVEAGKKAADDGKFYQGDERFDQEGKARGENKQSDFHKKGHVIKGFKSSHHKDEDGKTEEFYDEEHSSGDKFNYGGQSGSFGKNAASGYKGGHDNGEFNAVENKKQGQYDNHHIVDNNNADQGQYGEKKYGGNGETFASHNGVDQHSLLGHQEANKIFKHHPYHVPFYPSY